MLLFSALSIAYAVPPRGCCVRILVLALRSLAFSLSIGLFTSWKSELAHTPTLPLFTLLLNGT